MLERIFANLFFSEKTMSDNKKHYGFSFSGLDLEKLLNRKTSPEGLVFLEEKRF
jgi:hypothetical protein